MRFIERASIKRKQMLIILLITSVALLLACAAFGAYEALTFRKTMLSNVTMLAEIVGKNSAAALDFDDPKAAEETLSALRAEPNIVGACIYDNNGKVFAVFGRPGDGRIQKPPPFQKEGFTFGRDRLTLFNPIEYKGDVVGTVYIASDLRELYSLLERYAAIAGAVFGVTMLIAFALSAWLQRLVSDPILQLVETTRAVARDKDYSIRVARRSHDEIGELMDGFNEMLIQIQERDTVLRRAQGELEQRVRDRTQELAGSLSLIHATLESTADGILVADGTGKAINWNRKFMEMWRMPREVMEAGDEQKMIKLAVVQLKAPEQFTAKVQELYGHMERESFDLLEFKDGRIFERYSQPQRIGEKCVGRVWSFRDVTERKQAEKELAAERDLLGALLENSPDFIYFKDRQSRFLRISKTLVPRLGAKDVADVLGKSDFDFFKDEHARPAFEDEQKIIQTGQPLIGKIEKETLLNGQVLWVLSSKMPLRDPEGQIIGTFGISKDISPMKEAEAELAAERDLLGTLLENSPDMIYFKDRESRFLRSSRTHMERLGAKSVVEIQGKSDFDYFSDEHARPAFDDEQEIIRTGEPLIGKIEKETWEDGRVSWVLTSKMPLRNEAGEIVGTFGISKDITPIKDAEARLEQAHRQLLETSRMAGMAEVATSVLHNVGNVLNSVNVSCAVVTDRMHKSKVANLSRAVSLMREHEHDLAGFLAGDPKGKQLPAYLNGLAAHLATEQQEILQELTHLSTNIDHIKEIVAMQQSYSKVSGVRELLPAVDLVEDALRMNGAAFERHQVKVIREFEKTPPVMAEKHKVLQILINLLRNAKYACEDSGRPDKQVIVRIEPAEGGRAKISVIDNGVGIPAENLTRIFEHGFTTRKDGHGFGLHSGALAAKDMAGSLTAASAGPGRGACFVLELPGQTPEGDI
jgi:PAS domain S-box-containing protein